MTVENNANDIIIVYHICKINKIFFFQMKQASSAFIGDGSRMLPGGMWGCGGGQVYSSAGRQVWRGGHQGNGRSWETTDT